MIAVLDTSALLRFTDNEAGADVVERWLDQARRGEAQVFMSAVNWGEVVAYVLRTTGPVSATTRERVRQIRRLPFTIQPCGPEEAEAAALFKEQFKVPYADAFAGALATALSSIRRQSATLVTADNDFRQIPKNVLRIEFLPAKRTI